MKPFLILLIICGCSISMSAQNSVQEYTLVVKEKQADKDNGKLLLSMKIDVSNIDIPGDKSVICTPIIEHGDSVRALDPLIINGRSRHILYQRLNRPSTEQEYKRANGEEQILDYHSQTPYSEWMEQADVSLVTDDCGCGWQALQSDKSPLFTLDFSEPVVLVPQVAYLVPQAERVKARKLEGSAFLDFPVNKTAINPEYRRNPEELRKIRETIDAVRNDPYTTITRVKIKGYASPEGSYKANAYLAENRAKALSDYVKGLYRFEQTQFTVDFEPEAQKSRRRQ